MTAGVPSEESLPLSAELRIDAVCGRFEEEWKAVASGGPRPAIEAYLVAAAQSERAALLRELLALELHYRKQWGERPTREEYRPRFPEHGELLESLFAKHAEAESLHAPEPGESGTASSVPGQETGPELPSTDSAERPELPSIAGYEILGELGRGGMGVVYKARHTRLKRTVALKMILGGALVGPEHLARFRTEAEAVARLQHPHIVQIYEIGEHNGLPFLALEFVDGGSLSAKLAGNPQQPAEAALVVETLAEAMHAAHQVGVVHRDLKPANVLLTTGDALKVTDFGLAKQLDDPAGPTRSGAIMGTPSYMAPEQAAGDKDIGPAADVYALGAMLYECLTGRPPFKAATVLDTLDLVRTQEPVPPRALQPRVPRDLETVCLKCLRKEPARRYASAADLAADLRRYQEGKPILARPVGRLERAVKWARRRPAAAAFLAALIIGTVVSTSLAIYAKGEAELASSNEAAAVKANDELAGANTQLTEANIHLEQAKTHLEETNTQLEMAVARSLMGPLGLQTGPLTDPEIKNLWELVENRGDHLWYRFVEESLRSPVTTRQLNVRKVLALHAAVGLDPDRRAEVERLLLEHLNDPALRDEERGDVALVAVALGGLRPAAAADVAQTLRQAMKAMAKTHAPPTVTTYAEGLTALSDQLEAREATLIAPTLAQDLAEEKDGYIGLPLAQALAAVAARLEPGDGVATLVQAHAKQRLDSSASPLVQPRITQLPLARGLLRVSARLEPRDAATALCQVLAQENDQRGRKEVAWALSALADRLDSKDATAAAGTLARAAAEEVDLSTWESEVQALSKLSGQLDGKDAAALAQAFATAKIARNLFRLAQPLSALSARLEPAEAAHLCGDTAATLALALAKKTNPIDRNSFDQEMIVHGLVSLSGQLERKDAAAVAATLSQALTQEIDPYKRLPLAQALSAVSARLDPTDDARVCGDAAAALSEALAKETNPDMWLSLVRALPAVSVRVDAKHAATIAATLSQALAKVKDLRVGREQGQALSFATYWALCVVAARLEPEEAAATLSRVFDNKHIEIRWTLAEALSSASPGLDPEHAATIAARLCQALTKPTNPATPGQDLAQATDPDKRPLAQALAAVSARLDSKDAATAAAVLAQALAKENEYNAKQAFLQVLSAVSTRLDPKDAAAIAAGLFQALAAQTDPYKRQELAQALSAVSVGLDPKRAAPIARPLSQALTQETDPYKRLPLAQALSAVSARLDPTDDARVCGDAAAALCQALAHPTVGGNQALLARALYAVSARLHSKEAARVCGDAAAALSEALPRATDIGSAVELAHALSAVAPGLDPKHAATTAPALIQLAVLWARDPGPQLEFLAFLEALSAVAARLDPKDAIAIAATLSHTIATETNPGNISRDQSGPVRARAQAQALVAVEASLEPRDAALVAAALAQALTQAKDQGASYYLVWVLSVVLGNTTPAGLSNHAPAIGAGTIALGASDQSLDSIVLLAAAMQPRSPRLSPQQLVELLKQPLVVGESRRAVLDSLEAYYHRSFADQWEFIRFAQKQHLGLDFTSPPKRPEMPAAAPVR
jgi:hypothetical protein